MFDSIREIRIRNRYIIYTFARSILKDKLIEAIIGEK